MENVFAHIPHLGINVIFDEAQVNGNSHQRLMKDLITIYKSNKTDFTKEFLQCLACCLAHTEKQPCCERAMEFATKYCIYHENALNDETFLHHVFQFIFSHHSNKSSTIRFRSCDFIYKILNGKGEQAMLDDDVFLQIAETMLDRLQDKVPSIRAHAVLALQRLQDPYATDCPITKAFLFHMEHDPSADVRAKVVKNIAVTQQTLAAIFGRIYDVKISVRKEAVLALCRLKVQNLTIEFRQKLLNMGLHEKEEVIKACISRLISKWFRHCGQNFLQLLKMIDAETLEEETVQFVLFQLLREQPMGLVLELIKPLQSTEKLIPFDKLTPAVAVLWLTVVQYIEKSGENSENNDDDYSAEILPELTRFTKYIKAYSIYLSKGCKEKEYIMAQLIKLASTFSLSDEMGREQLKQVYRMLLTDENVEVGLVPIVLKHLEEVVPSIQVRSIMMAEIISDIREPLQESEHLSQENYEEDSEMLNVDKDQSKFPASLEDMENEREIRRDPETLIKCMTIVIKFMKGKDVTKIDGTLLTLKDHFIMPCFNEDNAQVVRLAQDALTLMCIWDLKLAQDNFINFCIQITDDSACLSAVESIFDLLLVHGFDAFNFGITDNNGQIAGSNGVLCNFSNDPTLTSPLMRYIVPVFVSLLQSNNPAMRAAIAQGLAKLFLASHINSPLVLANLILIWFSPSTDKEPMVRQPLGIFFSLFSRKRPGSAEIIIDSLLPTLIGLDEIFDDDLYSEINPLSVAKLLFSLVRPDVVKIPEQGGSYHYRLAVIICEEMPRATSNTLIVTLAKCLLLLIFSPEDRILAPKLLANVKKLIKKMGRYWERRVVKTMETFCDRIKKLTEDNKSHSKEAEAENCNSLEDDVLESYQGDKHRSRTGLTLKGIKEEVVSSPERNGPTSAIESCDNLLRNGEDNCVSPVGEDAPGPGSETDLFSNCSLANSSENDSSDDEKQKKTLVISESSASSFEEEPALNKFVNKSTIKRLAENKMSPRLLRSGRKRK